MKAYKSVNLLHFKLGTDLKINHCVFKDRTVVKIVKIIQCDITKTIYMIVQKYLGYESCFIQPCESTLFYGGTITNLCSVNKIVKLEEVLTVFITKIM